MMLYPKISADPALPVGAILYSRTVGGMDLHYRKFTCRPGAQYSIVVSRPEVPGMSLRGMPVYETGVNGIGIQFSDVVSSRVGNQIVGQAGSWPAPFSTWSDIPKQPYFSAWLVKTGPIDTSGATNINVEIEFRVADPAGTIPAEREGKFYWVNPKTNRAISFRNESCNISLRGPSMVNLQKISRSELQDLAQGATTGKGKTIDMNITCPTAMQGKKLTYWFNPLGPVGTDEGVLENTVSVGAQNVGIILKKDNARVKFFDTNAYQIQPLSLQQDISFTADYYMINPAMTDGLVKAMLEVVIQEDD
ncbi:fimbrial protein [Raoultella terrigena]|nr:fimbrial protein [Raoultella terrigena]